MKIKRILAIAGIVLLVAMYASTLVFSLMEGQLAGDLFRASILCTLIVPVFIYVYMMIYKYVKDKKNPPEDM